MRPRKQIEIGCFYFEHKNFLISELDFATYQQQEMEVEELEESDNLDWLTN